MANRADSFIGRSVPTDDVIEARINSFIAYVRARSAKKTTADTEFVRHREAGKVVLDRRLDLRNFELSDALEAYLENLSLARRSSFEAFVFGR